MRIRRLGILYTGILLIVVVIAMFAIFNVKMPTPNTVYINDLAKTIEEGADEGTIDQLEGEYGLNYYNQDGALVIYTDTETEFQKVKSLAVTIVIVLFVAASVLIFGILISVYKNILRPFDKLQSFAETVAKGNLDSPLLMDKRNVFGAFTESFDIMREELLKARENEKKANESKKELVASLSHDIKTPLASIKAINELLLVQSKDVNVREKLHSIDQKTEQIEVLVNNLFHATLEELEELKIHLEEVASTQILDMLKNADTSDRIENCQIEECILSCDPLRLQQVLDNIISNSYKYADSKISVSSDIEYGYLNIMIEDYGKGVIEEDVPLLKQKYYRGQNSDGKNGAGIGLYISDYFMDKMDGYLRIANGEHGFLVTIGIKLL